MTKHTIQLDERTQRFYQGVAAGSQVREAHEEIEWPDYEIQVRMFWFYVGALATGEHGCESNEDFNGFLLGAKTREPQREVED
jgi:hypothetical protein